MLSVHLKHDIPAAVKITPIQCLHTESFRVLLVWLWFIAGIQITLQQWWREADISTATDTAILIIIHPQCRQISRYNCNSELNLKSYKAKSYIFCSRKPFVSRLCPLVPNSVKRRQNSSLKKPCLETMQVLNYSLEKIQVTAETWWCGRCVDFHREQQAQHKPQRQNVHRTHIHGKVWSVHQHER